MNEWVIGNGVGVNEIKIIDKSFLSVHFHWGATGIISYNW